MDQVRFKHEHHDYIEHLDRLTLMAAVDPSALPATLPADRLVKLIGQEAIQLLRGAGIHFAFEEEGGYMADVLARRPDLTARVEAAHADHKVIRTDLIELIRATRVDNADVKELQAQSRSVVDLMHKHETTEVDIIQEAWEHDMGGGD